MNGTNTTPSERTTILLRKKCRTLSFAETRPADGVVIVDGNNAVSWLLDQHALPRVFSSLLMVPDLLVREVCLYFLFFVFKPNNSIELVPCRVQDSWLHCWSPPCTWERFFCILHLYIFNFGKMEKKTEKGIMSPIYFLSQAAGSWHSWLTSTSALPQVRAVKKKSKTDIKHQEYIWPRVLQFELNTSNYNSLVE